MVTKIGSDLSLPLSLGADMKHYLIFVCMMGLSGCGANKSVEKGTDDGLKSVSTIVSPNATNRPPKGTVADTSPKTSGTPGNAPGKSLPPRN
jgi:hypothetical protein